MTYYLFPLLKQTNTNKLVSETLCNAYIDLSDSKFSVKGGKESKKLSTTPFYAEGSQTSTTKTGLKISQCYGHFL